MLPENHRLLFPMFLITLVPSCAGPMARDVDSLALCMQALLCDHMFSLDPTVPPVPFNVQVCPPQNRFMEQTTSWLGLLTWTDMLFAAAMDLLIFSVRGHSMLCDSYNVKSISQIPNITNYTFG